MDFQVSKLKVIQITASERRVIFTKWVGTAWEEISSKKDLIINSFKVCGISVAIDGSEDSKISIKDLEDYTVGSDDSSDSSDSEELTDDEDPFADC